MVRLFETTSNRSRDGLTHRPIRARIACETLEDRQLLSGGAGFAGSGFAMFGGHRSPAAERGSFGGARQDGMFGAGALGLGGAARNPLLFLTAPLIAGTSTSPPSPGVMSNSSVQTALQTLETDLKNDTPSGAKPTHASIGQLQDDLASIHKGTLTGTAATTAIQNDQTAILTSLGLTSAQITQIQSDQQALQTAIQSASSSTSTSSSTTSTTSATPSTTTPGSWQPGTNTPPGFPAHPPLFRLLSALSRRISPPIPRAAHKPRTPRLGKYRMTWMPSELERSPVPRL